MSYQEFRKEYKSSLMRGKDRTLRPRITREQIIKYGGTDKNLLDIGCGTAHKTALYAGTKSHYYCCASKRV